MLRSLFKSTASNVLKFAVALVITFIMTPVYVSELGNYDYGIWEILLSVVGYLGLLDIGLRPTIARFIAYYRTSENPEDQQELFTTTLCLMVVVGGVISLILVGWSLLAPHMLAPDDAASAERYAIVLQIFAVHVLFSFPYFALESTFEGRLCYATKNNIIIGHSIIGAIVLYNFLPLYDPLIFLVTFNVVTAASKFFIFFTILNTRAYGGYRLRVKSFNPSMVGRLLRFGGKAMMQGIAGRISQRTDPLIIGIFLGPQKVVFFTLANMLIQRVSGLTMVLSHAFMPAFSTMLSRGDQLAIERYFFNGTKYIFALKVASCLGIGVIGDSFISLWIGPEYGEAARPLIWLLVASSLIAGALPLHNRLLTALNYHGSLAILYLVRAFINVLLTAALIIPFGLIGVALATLLSQAMVAPFVWRAVFKHLKYTPVYYLRYNLGPALLAAGLMAVIILVFSYINGLETWFSLVVCIAIGVAAFIPLFLFIAMRAGDWDLLLALWKRGRKAISSKA